MHLEREDPNAANTPRRLIRAACHSGSAAQLSASRDEGVFVSVRAGAVLITLSNGVVCRSGP